MEAGPWSSLTALLDPPFPSCVSPVPIWCAKILGTNRPKTRFFFGEDPRKGLEGLLWVKAEPSPGRCGPVLDNSATPLLHGIDGT